jgi:hypothetical protein
MVAFSGLEKIRRDPHILHVINEVMGVPLMYFLLLAACELAGALGLVLGIWWPRLCPICAWEMSKALDQLRLCWLLLREHSPCAS